MRRIVVSGFAVSVLFACLGACGHGQPAPPGPKTQPGDASPSASDAAAGDAAEVDADAQVAVSVRCSDAEFDAAAGDDGGDYTAVVDTAIEVTFPAAAGPAQYTKHCLKVKAGATVSFRGSFVNHPLQPSGGDVPTPIPSLTNADPEGGALVLTMSTPGTFGYECTVHPGTMYGAVKVVP